MEKNTSHIEWHCISCFATLNDQPGFDEQASSWTCLKCGHTNLNPCTEPKHTATNRKG
ncbi:MAG: Sec23/Sec24 zinc finger-containing protein [Clostridia bacterium]|nr:Sec23/Sec24 zinc finger-containing protein [Clostridia bacterium]